MRELAQVPHRDVDMAVIVRLKMFAPNDGAKFVAEVVVLQKPARASYTTTQTQPMIGLNAQQT